MEWIVVTGRTLEEAVERALDSLGVHETELDYEVLSEAKSSLFGLRRTEARIRARVKPRSREKPTDKRRRQRDDQRGKRRTRSGSPSGSGPQAPRDTTKAAAGATAARATAPGAGESAGNADPASGTATRTRRRRSRGSGSSGRGSAGGAPETAAPKGRTNARDDSVDDEEQMMERSGSIEEQVSAGREFAVGLLDAFDAKGTVAVEPLDQEIEVRIDGDNLGLLVGPKGTTLAALEELLRGAVGHRGPGRLHLDVAGYRAKRKAALADFARRVADDVRSSGAAKALEPMSAPDRKVVHDTVAELDGVSTISDGEDPRRRVIIQPA
jgi:spoIIIJ-associated protein